MASGSGASLAALVYHLFHSVLHSFRGIELKFENTIVKTRPNVVLSFLKAIATVMGIPRDVYFFLRKNGLRNVQKFPEILQILFPTMYRLHFFDFFFSYFVV